MRITNVHCEDVGSIVTTTQKTLEYLFLPLCVDYCSVVVFYMFHAVQLRIFGPLVHYKIKFRYTAIVL